MLKLIVLTSVNDEKIYVNPNQICDFYKLNSDTIVQFADAENYRYVKETPEEIMNMIVDIPKVINI